MPDAAPRWLAPEAAAQYIGVRVDHLPRLLKAGKLPAPSLYLGPRTPRYDREALDALFGGGAASEGADAAAERAANRIMNGQVRSRRQKAAR